MILLLDQRKAQQRKLLVVYLFNPMYIEIIIIKVWKKDFFKVKMTHSILFFSQIEHIQKIGALEIEIFPTPLYCAPNVVGFL